MSRLNYPPSHRNTDEVQPELCDICGNEVGGHRLVQSEVEGLRGLFVCDTGMCAQFRSALTYNDRRRFSDQEHTYIGQSRVYPAGASKKFDTD